MPKRAMPRTKLVEPDPQVLDAMQTMVEGVIKDFKGYATLHDRRLEVQDLRPRVRRRVDMVRSGPLCLMPMRELNAYFDLAVKDLKQRGKLVVIPIMSRPGDRRFDKKKRCFSREPWVMGYEYEWCDSLLDALALVAS